MKIDFTNVFATGVVTLPKFRESGTQIAEFLRLIDERNQGFYQIFDDVDFLAEIEKIKEFATAVAGKYDDIVLCGIGGSALGARTIRDSLTSPFAVPRLHIIDNVDSEIIAEISDNIDYARTLFIVISKSGTTIETQTQYHYFREILEQKKLSLADHMVFVTGTSGFLRVESDTHHVQTFSIPPNIGGRFSVLTAVGLLPAALLGIDIDELVAGGQKSAKLFRSENFGENLPFQLAAAQFLAKKNINVLMPYSAKLQSFSHWFTQLLAESTGKNSKGITALAAVGVTDQHSQLQLFVDGPGDKLIMFIEVIKKSRNLPQFNQLMQAEMHGTAQALTEKGKPNFMITIDEISPHTLGELFMLFMGATAFLGEFMEINAFDQPGVERGKVLTREILGK